MFENLFRILKNLPVELITLIIAASPIAELRGAIPVAIAMNAPPVKTFFIAVIGNLIPVVPLLVLLGPISSKLRRFRLWHSFFEGLFNRTKRRASIVQRWGSIGLVLFVALPLPMTGAWTGCVAASLFKIRFRYAFLAVTLGVIIAGVVVTILTLLGKELISL